jgi:uridylate kinase
VSIGGSVLVPKEGETKPILDIAGVLGKCASELQLFVTVGGGATARDYIHWGRSLRASEQMLDSMGIQATRINALLLVSALQGMGRGADVLRFAPTTVLRAIKEGRRKRIVIMGGTVPGHTTDAVAAMLAESSRASRLVNATSVDGVYSADPLKDPRARRIDRMSYADLLALVDTGEWRAGPNLPFDAKGVRALARSRIPLMVVKGTERDELESAILDRPFNGTRVG